MSTPIKKVVDMAADLAYQLSARGLTVATSTDSSGNPTMTVGTATAGNSAASIRVMNVDPLGVDSLGNTIQDFAQCKMQIITEATADPAVAADPSKYVTAPDMMNILGTMAGFGTRIEVYLCALASNPTITVLDATGVLVATFDPSIKYRLMGQQ